MYGISPQAYDRAITVFSPDGRLFQVEYAKEAVKRGATSLGISSKNGVVLIATKIIYSPLIYTETLKKIFKIDDHVYATASGLIADIRKLIDIAREESRRFRLLYEQPAPLAAIVGHVVDIMQLYTQYGGTRPFGASLLIAGRNEKSNFVVYEIEPSGAYTGYKAVSIGEHRKEVDTFLEKHYKENLKIEEMIKIGLKALKHVHGDNTHLTYEIAYLSKGADSFVSLDEKEVMKYYKKVK